MTLMRYLFISSHSHFSHHTHTSTSPPICPKLHIQNGTNILHESYTKCPFWHVEAEVEVEVEVELLDLLVVSYTLLTLTFTFTFLLLLYIF